MSKYVVVYYSPVSATEQMKDATPEDMKKGMETWMAWAERCGEGLLDIGSPLGGGLTVTDGGTSPSDKNVVGYSMLQAEDIDGALVLLQGHPHLGWAEGCEIEVQECLPVPG